ncbi:MAG: putative toxin-antitoxin system toxin component, PIN family [Actinobacteria bacterium]|nr:putative toxin-antitoxin system toxin component, PIN family [Actinomycetota bacterium]
MADPLRVVLDPGVIVSALVTPHGPTGRLITVIQTARVRPIVCPHLVDELTGVLHRTKFRRYLTVDEADEAIELLVESAEPHDEPNDVPPRSRDPKDDYLIALAIDTNAAARCCARSAAA